MAQKRHRLTTAAVVRDYLIPYKKEHGDLLIPNAYKAPDGFALGSWLHRRRHLKKKGLLPDEDVRALEEAGVVWSARDPLEWIPAAEEYYFKHGDLEIPQDYVTPDGLPLGSRLHNARTGFRTGSLNPKVKLALYKIDPEWATRAQRRPPKGTRCSVEGCGGLNHARDMCRKHYNLWYKHGSPTSPVEEEEEG